MRGLRANSQGDRMKRPLGMCLSPIFALAPNAVAQEKPPLKLVATTPLAGFSGDFDHFALDLKGKRLFLTAEDHKTVDVFDLEGKHLHSITGFGQPHAALFLPESNKLIVSDGDDDFGKVELVRGEDYKILRAKIFSA